MLSAPTGCSPRDYGGLLAVDCSLCILILSLDLVWPCQVQTEPVGACKVHPLGVVPETMVDYGQSTVVLVFIVFVVFLL